MKLSFILIFILSVVFSRNLHKQSKHKFSSNTITGIFTRNRQNCNKICKQQGGKVVCGKLNWDCCQGYGCDIGFFTENCKGTQIKDFQGNQQQKKNWETCF